MKPTNFWHKSPLWQAAGETGSAPAEPVIAPTEPSVDTGPDLSFVPADFHVDGKPDLGKFKDHYATLKADADARAAKALPETYDFALPADLKFDGLDLPEGFAVTALTEDPAFQPLYAELGGFLKEIGADADAGPKVASLLARYKAAETAKEWTAAKAEVEAEAAKLGPQADARIATVSRLLETRLPAEQAQALQGFARSAEALKAIETLLGPKTMGSPPPAPPPPADPLAARYPHSVA
ncbi:MAG: hypothetical protein ACRC14_11870 [Paracoccaceae bacterium]